MYLSRIEQRTFDGPAGYLRDPAHRASLDEYLRDLVRPYGLALREDDRTGGQSYGEMAEALIRSALPADEPVDLLVLAFSVPDVRPGRATATYLSLVCPGNPMAFAICDQGSAAAFTGLRLAGGYLGTGGCRRAALLVLEQATLHHEPAVPVALPARHAAVALVCVPDPPARSGDAGDPGPGGPADAADTGAGGPARVGTIRQHAGVEPDRATALLDAELAELSAGHADVTVVLGGGLPAPRGYRVRRAPAEQPGTGTWSELADALGARPAPGPGRVLVAGYDATLRYLCLLAIDR